MCTINLIIQSCYNPRLLNKYIAIYIAIWGEGNLVAVNQDFIVKNGLQVTSNVVVGAYTGTATPIANGIISSGNVGIGTSLTRVGDRLSVISGNISLSLNDSQTGYGIVFSDGTIQRTANTGAFARYEFTTYAGQTNFLVAYTPNFVDVYYNGTLLSTTEYTATDGTTVVLTSAAIGGDPVIIIAWALANISQLTGPTGPSGQVGPTGPMDNVTGPTGPAPVFNVNSQTGDYIIEYADIGNIITINSSSTSNVTVSNTLSTGFHTSVIREGTGAVNIVGSGVTLNSPTNNFSIIDQYGTVKILLLSATTGVVSGNV